MINCYSLFSFRFLCLARLPEKSQHLHLLLIKTLLMLIDFYIVNLLPRVSCYVTTWFNSLSAAHLRFRTDTCIKAPHWGYCNFQTPPLNTKSSTTEVAEFHQICAQVMKILTRLPAKVHWGKSPGGHRNHPGPCSVGSWGVWGRRARSQAWSRGQRAEGAGGGSWGLSSTRQAALPEDALSWREGCSKKAK